MALLRLALLALLLASASAARAEGAREAELKAGFAFNFMALSKWPPGGAPGMRFCVAGGVVPPAFQVLVGKSIGEHPITLAAPASPESVAGCHVLYIPAGQAPKLRAWLASVARRPVLTISEQADGQRNGAVIAVRPAADRVVFDVDLEAAASAGIVLSSQLTKLAQMRF